MANVFVLCLTLYQVSEIISETSFHQGMSAQRHENSEETFSAQQIDSFSPYHSWEDNVIPSSEISELDLNSINRNILRLHQMISQQSDLIQFLISGQNDLSKENSKWVKRYKSTRKYLRKLNRACVYRPSGLDYSINSGKHQVSIPSRRQTTDDVVVRNSIQTEHTGDLDLAEVLAVKPEAHVSRSSNHVDKKSKPNAKINRHIEDSQPSLSEIIKSLPFTENESIQLNNEVKMSLERIRNPPSFANDFDPLLETLPIKDHREKDAGFEIDLTNGQVQGKDSRITWEENLIFGQHVKCGLVGVVKIDLRGLDTWSLVVEMWFNTPAGSVFHIANSPSEEKTLYEVKGYDEVLEVSSRFNMDDPLKVIYHEDKAITSKITLFFNKNGISRKLPSGRFELFNNTSVLTNEDILYLSMNRVIAPRVLSAASGLCNVKFNWF